MQNNNERQTTTTALTMEQELYLAVKRIEVQKLKADELRELVLWLMEMDLRKHNATVALVGQLMGITDVTDFRPTKEER